MNSNFEKYFMSEAERASKEGREPGTQIGFCVVDENNRIVDTAYSGAFFKNNGHLSGCKTYATIFPSIKCVKDIARAGIKEIIYKAETDNGNLTAVKRMLDYAQIKTRKITA